MRVLLDTHAFLWFAMGDPRLSAAARSIIEDPNNIKLVSAATIWEIAIKVSIHKLTLTVSFDDLLKDELGKKTVQLLPIEAAHAVESAKMPFHHRDPFDRMLVAQAIVEQVPLVSADAVFDQYGVQRLWT